MAPMIAEYGIILLILKKRGLVTYGHIFDIIILTFKKYKIASFLFNACVTINTTS